MGMEAMIDGIGKPMEVKELKAVRMHRDFGNCNFYGTSKVFEVACVADNLERAWREDTETHLANCAALDHNARMRKAITEMMTAAGVPDHFYAPKPGSRAYIPKKVKHQAGYIGDLARTFKISDGYAEVEKLYRSKREKIDKLKAEVQREKEAAAAESERVLKRRQADIKLGTIIVRYELPETTDWDDALSALRVRDKYLDLAIAGLQTRGDWSDGFYRVEDALRRFKIENDQDKDIMANLSGRLIANDRDGRIFRDTEWSYDKLFDLVVDKTLLADARTCLENVT